MADWLTPEQRSRNMASIRSRGNASTEQKFARLLRTSRITGWRRHLALPGKPDFVFRQRRIAVFLDGCFWHGCPRCYQRPQSSQRYWDTKLARNRKRDRQIRTQLRRAGWRVIRIWEHEVRKYPGTALRKLTRLLLGIVPPANN